MITWDDILFWLRNGNVKSLRRVEKTAEQWAEQLSKEQFEITRLKATERPFSGQSCATFSSGSYACVCCEEVLFDADQKFESHSGWPSFTQPINATVIDYLVDESHDMQRVEVVCSVCDAHLGHVFSDGPRPSGLRYCVNSLAIVKV